MNVLRQQCLLWFVVCVSAQEDLCHRCQCLPLGGNPSQAICHGDGRHDQVFLPTTTELSQSLQVVFVYGMTTVTFTENSLVTEQPVTLFIQNCTEVNVFDRAVPRLRTLLVREAARVHVGVLNQQDLWATVLENIEELTVSSASLMAYYSVTVGRIGTLTVEATGGDDGCSESPEFKFLLFNSKVKPIQKGGITLCGGEITLNGNTFEHIAEEGLQVTVSEGSVALVYNKFQNLSKLAFNLTSPEIHISNNHFDNLPAGALRGVSTLLDTFFTNNSIQDVDLGGVLLDMGWDMIVEQNTLGCDCASKRTSILNPKEDMIYLTNSSFEKLQNIFQFNFCSLGCGAVTLKEFSYALRRGDVCVTNDTKLEEELLCQSTAGPNTSTDGDVTEDPPTVETATDGSVYSAAAKVEFLVPLIVVIVAALLGSYYGCKEMNSFKYKFRPNRSPSPKMSME